jgi:hypothetical protein
MSAAPDTTAPARSDLVARLKPAEMELLRGWVQPGCSVNVLQLAQSLRSIDEGANDLMASIDALADAVLALLPEQPNSRAIFAVRQLVDADIRGHVGRLVERINDLHTACGLRQLGGEHV